MGKILRPILQIAAIAVNFIPGLGQLASLAITAGLSLASAALAPKAPKVSPAQRERLYATIDPSAPRKIVFGQTAMATDIRYEEWSGTNQEYLDRIVAVASHKVQAIEEIWFDDKLAWTSAGGVQSPYSGYLTVQTRLEGTAANTIAINGGSKWGSSRRLTGCAYVHLRYKTTGNSKKTESPFASSIPQRMTIKGKGALLYDPRLDSTVGGSGSQRADDQSTWAWTSDAAGNNPALQMLWYLLGWRINGKLAVGRGIPKSRILMSAFIAAANLCEEAVSLAAGGSEPRYRSAGVVSEADAPSAVIDAIEASCAGTLRDASGRLALDILHNDLATALSPGLTDADVIGQCDWQQTKSLDESFNVVRGRYTDPSNNALYQLVDYPAVSLPSPDGLERIHVFDLSMVQSASQAQRLAKQELQRAQYQGVFKGEFKATAWRCQVGSIVPFTFSALGFSNKLFRVVEQVVRMDGTCGLVLREENAAIYAWATEETAPVQAAAPTPYDPNNSPLIQGIVEGDNPNSLTINEKISNRIPKENERSGTNGRYPTVRARMVALGLSVTALDNASAAWIAHRDAVPGWNNTSFHSTIVRTTWDALDKAFDDQLNLGDIAISQEDARRATIDANGNLVGDGTNVSNALVASKFTNIGSSNVTIEGNSIRREIGDSNYQACVRGEPIAGACFAECLMPSSGYAMVSLDTEATGVDYAEQRITIHAVPNGSFSIYLNGSAVHSGASIAPGQTVRLVYDGTRYQAFLNGNQVGPDFLAAPGLTHYAKFHNYNGPNIRISGLDYGPYSQTSAETKFIVQTAAGPTLRLIGANAIIREGSGSWDSQCYSERGYSGGAFCSFSPIDSSCYFMAGLNSDPTTDASYFSLDYAFYMAGDANIYIYESGGGLGNFGTWAAGTVLSIIYDNEFVRYLINGEEVRCVRTSNGRKFHFDSSVVQGAAITNLRFGPVTPDAASVDFIHDADHQSQRGNSVYKNSKATDGFNTKSVSRQVQTGTAFVSGKLSTYATFLGLKDSGDGGASYTAFRASFHRSGDGNWYTWSYSGGRINMGTSYNGVTFNENTEFRITYDGVQLRWYADNTLMDSTGDTPNRTYAAGVAIGDRGCRVDNIQFGPYTDNAWSSVGGTGRPEDGATVGARAGTNLRRANNAIVGDVEVLNENQQWNQVNSRPLLITGDYITADELLRDPSVWASLPANYFQVDSDGTGYLETPSGTGATLIPLFANGTPIDPNATYEAEWQILEAGGGAPTAAYYTVVVAWDAAGNVINGDGTFWYYPSAFVTNVSRGSYEKRFARFGKGTLRPFPSNAVKFGVGLLANYNASAVVTRARRIRARRIDVEPLAVNGDASRWQMAHNSAVRVSGPDFTWGATIPKGKSVIRGAQSLSFDVVAGSFMCGLSDVTNPALYTDIDYAWYYLTSGTLVIYESGSYVTEFAGYTNPDDVRLSIVYDGNRVKYYINGSLARDVAAGTDRSFRVAVDSYLIGAGVRNIRHVAIESNAYLGVNLRDSANAVLTEPDVLNHQLEGNLVRIATPVGGAYSFAGGITGAVKIELPAGVSDAMVKFVVDIYEYDAQASQRYEIAGYTYSGSGGVWINCTAHAVGKLAFTRPVYFGREGGRFVVWIGTTTTNWSYPGIRVRDVQVSYSSLSTSLWKSGWAVSFQTSAFAAVDTSVSVPTAGDTVVGVNTRRASGGLLGSGELLNENQLWGQVSGSGRPEDNADVTSYITGSAKIVIECDNNGTPLSGQLTKNTPYKLMKNGVDETNNATWSSSVVLAGTITQSTANTGVNSITAISTLTARFRVSATLGSAVRWFDVDVEKKLAPAETGGSGSGGTSATVPVSFASMSNVMSTASNELIFNTGSAGTATMTGIVSFGTDGGAPHGSWSAYWIWQRWNGSAWVDVDTEVLSTQPTIVSRESDGTDWFYYETQVGQLDVGKVVTGLTANAQVKFRLRIRCASTFRTLYFYTGSNIGGQGS